MRRSRLCRAHWQLAAAVCTATGLLSPLSAMAQRRPATVKSTVGLRVKVTPALMALHREWHKALLNTPPPREGCFTSEYPRIGWQEVQCVKPPNIPMPPRHGVLPYTVGNGYDYSAQVSGDLLSVIGSFDTATTTGEKGFTYQSPTTEVSDAYTLQVNSNFFSSPPACSGATTPASCQGWQQYVYSSKSGGSAYMQYWLLNYNKTCPSGWNTYGSDC